MVKVDGCTPHDFTPRIWNAAYSTKPNSINICVMNEARVKFNMLSQMHDQ